MSGVITTEGARERFRITELAAAYTDYQEHGPQLVLEDGTALALCNFRGHVLAVIQEPHDARGAIILRELRQRRGGL